MYRSGFQHGIFWRRVIGKFSDATGWRGSVETLTVGPPWFWLQSSWVFLDHYPLWSSRFRSKRGPYSVKNEQPSCPCVQSTINPPTWTHNFSALAGSRFLSIAQIHMCENQKTSQRRYVSPINIQWLWRSMMHRSCRKACCNMHSRRMFYLGKDERPDSMTWASSSISLPHICSTHSCSLKASQLLTERNRTKSPRLIYSSLHSC